MSTITAILEPATDGTVHIPVPAELRHERLEVIATMRPAPKSTGPLRAGCLPGFWTAPDFNAPVPEFKDYTE